MKNPYEVLGVPETATDDEVKTAYRNLAKKYHPDNYTDSPLADVAEQKMKEINEAYDTICSFRQKSRGNSSTGTQSSGSASSQFYNVRVFIQQNRIDDAERELDSTPMSMRIAEWYFLKGMCANRRGWNEQAYNDFTTACNMEPGNSEYRAALNSMNRQRAYGYGGYNQPYNTPDAGYGCSVCDICTACMCADCMSSCCRMGC